MGKDCLRVNASRDLSFFDVNRTIIEGKSNRRAKLASPNPFKAFIFSTQISILLFKFIPICRNTSRGMINSSDKRQLREGGSFTE